MREFFRSRTAGLVGLVAFVFFLAVSGPSIADDGQKHGGGQVQKSDEQKDEQKKEPCEKGMGTETTPPVNCADYAVAISAGDKAWNGQTCASGRKCNATGLTMHCPTSGSPYTCKTVIINAANACDCRCAQ